MCEEVEQTECCVSDSYNQFSPNKVAGGRGLPDSLNGVPLPRRPRLLVTLSQQEDLKQVPVGHRI